MSRTRYLKVLLHGKTFSCKCSTSICRELAPQGKTHKGPSYHLHLLLGGMVVPSRSFPGRVSVSNDSVKIGSLMFMLCTSSEYRDFCPPADVSQASARPTSVRLTFKDSTREDMSRLLAIEYWSLLASLLN